MQKKKRQNLAQIIYYSAFSDKYLKDIRNFFLKYC